MWRYCMPCYRVVGCWCCQQEALLRNRVTWSPNCDIWYLSVILISLDFSEIVLEIHWNARKKFVCGALLFLFRSVKKNLKTLNLKMKSHFWHEVTLLEFQAPRPSGCQATGDVTDAKMAAFPGRGSATGHAHAHSLRAVVGEAKKGCVPSVDDDEEEVSLSEALGIHSPEDLTVAPKLSATPPSPTPGGVSAASSSRRKRKSSVVMRRGIPSTSPRSIQLVTSPSRHDVIANNGVLGNATSTATTPTTGGSNVPYYCPTCDKTFSRQFSWKVHMNVHRGIFPYTCNECGKGFTSHINLKGHLVQHTNRREFKCAACGKEFIYKRGLNAHIPICKGVSETSFMYEEAVWEKGHCLILRDQKSGCFISVSF